MSSLSETVRIQDVLKWVVNQDYCLEKLTLKASTIQTIQIGSPLRDNTGYILVANGQEANVTAIALEAIVTESVDPGDEILCLVRGPAIVDETRVDAACEASVGWSEIEAYLLALGIIGLAEATNYEEGTPIT